MADQGRCDNCGAMDDLTPCSTVWREEHSHPLAYNDLTPVACDLDICRKCVRRLRSNLPSTVSIGDAGAHDPSADQAGHGGVEAIRAELNGDDAA